MPLITLKNNKNYFFKNSISLYDIASKIYPNKKQLYIAGYINGKLVDMIDLVDQDSKIEFITIKNTESIKIIRNSCIYLFEYAIKKIWPSINIISNNIIDYGFYFDIELNFFLKKNDFNKIENFINKLIYKNYKILKKKINIKEAFKIFNKKDEKFKKYFLNKKINKNKFLNIYYYKNYLNISNIPHVSNINFCKYFKLIKISFLDKNINNNCILQRIYITSWRNKKELDNYLNSFKEILKRDHRKINKQLNLYDIQENLPGMVFWNKNGFIIFKELKKFIRKKLKKYNYKEVKTPFMMNKSLWKKTGHWKNFSDKMFSISSENIEYCIKPMNCPGHIQIFKIGIKSYKNLPFRIAEFGICHRKEPSGSLHGLMRLKEFTQDDAHIFCTKKQVYNEIKKCINMTYDIYKIFGFKKILVKFSTKPKKYIGSDEIWKSAEKDLENVLKNNNIKFTYEYGNGAFYGPKIEFTLLDSLNRLWQCGTIQLDFFLSIRLNATYINEKNEKKFPIIIHRAILGSIERFIGIITEEYIGNYPTWLSPIQVILINITYNQESYIKKIKKIISLEGIRVKKDLRNEKIGFKIREHILSKIPYIIICGDKEVKNNTVSLRTRYGKNLNNISLIQAIKDIKKDIVKKNIFNKGE
ncbi:threonine--tRNA ligase [Sodalis-like secondary symbiont of Drepanosiphum platanoidis]|uniref:threonine--tRNA ligase n=1 Tax=Sodalis-like secondary symbiont of Drepanosiphum platanoidis TaxID=2994493 RepID=UPI00346457DC